jgi:hypothetical protein
MTSFFFGRQSPYAPEIKFYSQTFKAPAPDPIARKDRFRLWQNVLSETGNSGRILSIHVLSNNEVEFIVRWDDGSGETLYYTVDHEMEWREDHWVRVK